MKVIIQDRETGNRVHGNTRLSPEAFAEAFRRSYSAERFSYKIILVDVKRNGEHRVFKSALGLDPSIVNDWIRSTAIPLRLAA